MVRAEEQLEQRRHVAGERTDVEVLVRT